MGNYFSIEVVIGLICGLVAIAIGIYEFICNRSLSKKIKSGSSDLLIYKIKPKIILIESPTDARYGSRGYVRKIKFQDLKGKSRNFEFEFDQNILPQSLIDEYREIKKKSGKTIDHYTTDFADSNKVEGKRLSLVKDWIMATVSSELTVKQDSNHRSRFEVEDPLLILEGQINNDLRETKFKQSPKGGRYMLLFIIIIFGSIIWYARNLQNG